MSLLDALLLDPVRMDIFVAHRTDGAGSGTQSDPFDGSTTTKFDTLMRVTIPSLAPQNVCIHLGPGTFTTAGYYDGLSGSGWQAKPGMRIVGSGIDVTTLKLVNQSASTERVYAIAHALSSTTVDSFEVSDLTINCNLTGVSGSSSTAGAVRVMGNHSRVVRVKVINWGTHHASTPAFVIAMLTGDPSAVTGVNNCGIQECIAVEPGNNSPSQQPTASTVTVLHVGGKETAGSSNEAFGLAPYIRNCFVDCGANGLTRDFRALSMAWCKGGVVEGNQVHNTKHGGPYQEATGARDVVVSNNVYRNVYKGPYWSMTTQGVQKLLVEGNSIEFAAGAGSTDHAIELDDLAAGTPPHGNVLVRNNRIRYVDGASGNAKGIKVYGAGNLLVRENVVELSQANPLYNLRCGSAQYFANRTPAGVLIRGKNEATSTLYSELETDAEDALVLALMKRT